MSSHMPLAVPSALPIEPRPGKIVFGLMLGVLGLWMLFDWVPSHRPLDDFQTLAYAVDSVQSLQNPLDHWVFKPGVYPLALGLSILLGIAGIEQLIVGMTYRPFKVVHCRRCNASVVARKSFSGLRCPHGAHMAQASTAAWLLVILLGLLALIVVVTMSAH